MATAGKGRTGARVAFREVSQRHGDFAIVALAAIGTRDGVRLGVGGVADRPAVRDLPWLEGSALDDALNDFAWALGGNSRAALASSPAILSKAKQVAARRVAASASSPASWRAAASTWSRKRSLCRWTPSAMRARTKAGPA